MSDVCSNRLEQADYGKNYADLHPPLSLKQAQEESARCYYCHDAPCVEACPTGIDIPSFIRKITTGNLHGSAMDILRANIMGGTCARVCPVETLCQDACVRNTSETKPVTIGRLQRHATDALFASGAQPFTRAEATGKRVAVVGGGPAGLACAHGLARQGHHVTIFEGREKLGGLNEYGLAAYKMLDDFAQKEVRFILSVGGIEVKTGQALGKQIQLGELRQGYDAVFLGMGLAGVRSLRLDGEKVKGVHNAVDTIAEIRQAQDLAQIPVGRKVVVIGGGNTAVDIAVQIKKLGAEFVTMVYRRGTEQMGATWFEQEFAQTSGVSLKTWAKPVELRTENDEIRGVRFEYTRLGAQDRLEGTGKFFELEADQVFKAIGQVWVPDSLGKDAGLLETTGGKILVDENRRTSLKGVYAGGDCVQLGEDLTVSGVEDGKQAAAAIHAELSHG